LNTFFQFKQFTIHQENCAMKVCTDACLFGAWVADKLEKKEFLPKKIFDIGCGTGLLSLMLAQKTGAIIDAIEIDADAFLQATENVADSPFKDQVNIFHGPIEQFFAHEKYDFIICNPPFYENQLKSGDDAKNVAMHATSLSFMELADAIKNNLSEYGTAAILIPYHSVTDFVKYLSKVSLYIYEQLNISHAPNKKLFRSILLISSQKKVHAVGTISIKTNIDTYSGEFTHLLKDYYLIF
jgi:tRNA1Val (adenine37-N6)-methyltransferase